MKTRTLIFLGVLAFVVFLIASAPVALIWPKLAPNAPMLTLGGLEGGVFHGSAAAASVRGKPVARPLRWQFRPAALLTGQLGYRLQADGDGLLWRGDLGIGFGGQVRIGDLELDSSVRGLMALAGSMILPIDGSVSARFERLRLANGFPDVADGRIDLRGLRLALGAQGPSLGDYAIDVRSDAAAGAIVATVSPTSGPLDVDGEVRLFADRHYEVDLRVKAKPDAPEPVKNIVRSIGPADTDGYFRIKQRIAL